MPADTPHDIARLYGAGRLSAQRGAIARAVLAMPGAFTAEELHRSVGRHSPGVGLATAYRALTAMQAAGSLAVVGERDGSALFARCDRHDHHHHLLCTACDRVIAVDCPLDPASLEPAATAGHVVTHHDITLYGLCAACRHTGDGG